MSQKNKVKFNLKNVHYAMLELDAQGVPTFAAPVPIPGAVSISLDANGEPENFYADGYAYYVINNNMGYEGDLEVALIPESFRVDALKETRDANGVLIEDANTGLGRFALLFEFDGDKRHIRHVMYNCAASRPNIEGQTNEESKEVQTETLTLNVSPLPNGMVKAKTGDITSDAVYNAWYDAVYISSAGAGDATLSALTIGSLTLSPTFDEDVTEYTATATNAADAVTATATEDGAGVVVVVNGNSIGNGEDATWETGENTVAITVTSGEVSRTYTVTVTKE
jgi:phi13 family phage major tail protein